MKKVGTDRYNNQKADALLLRSPKILALALEKKELEVKSLKQEIVQRDQQLKLSSEKKISPLFFVLLVLGLLVIAYGLYANYRASTKIEKQYTVVIQKVRDAYRGDKDAHAEIVRLIPEITRRRLPKTLPKPGSESFRSDTSVSQGIESTQNSSSTKPANTEDGVPVYNSPSDDPVVLGFLIDDANVVRVEPSLENPGWAEVMLSLGFPAWVEAMYLIDDKSSLLRINTPTLNLHAEPFAESVIMGSMNNGDLVNVISRDAEWFQVRTPANFKYWVRSGEFERLTE